MNKKFFLIQFFLLLLISFAFSNYLPGTIQNPYKIIDCNDLQNMENDLNAVYALQNDITCYNPIIGKVFDFRPIGGNGGEEFSGRLNGNGFTIGGLRPINKDYTYLGLFGVIKNAQVTNLRIVLNSKEINNDKVDKAEYFGGLAGKAINSDINGVIVEGEWGYEGIVSIDEEYVDKNYTYFHRAGGLIGIAENTYISGCVNRVNFKGGYYYLGGIVGRAKNTIIYNSKNIADIQPYYNKYSNGECVQLFNGYIGGIASEIISSQIVDCINDGNRIELPDGQLIRKGKLKGDFVGGIVYFAGMDNGESQIINCSNFADINAVGDCGGIAVDISQTIIEHSSNCGDIYGGEIGGIVYYARDSVIHKVSNNGSINSDSSGYVGGIVGYASNSTILKTVNTNQINLVSDGYHTSVGGVVGGGEHNFLEDCVNLGAISVIGLEFEGKVGGIAGELDHSEINKAYNYVNRGDINIFDFFHYSKSYDNAWSGLWRSSFVNPGINSFTGNYSYYSTNVGGIGGYIRYSILNKVYNFFDVNPTNNNNYTSGGLFGYILNDIIIDTNNFGEVSPKFPQNNYTNKFIASGSDSYVDGNGADLYLENSKTSRTNLNGVGNWYFDNDSVNVTNLSGFSSSCVGVGKIVGSTNDYETTNFGFNGLLKWRFVDNNTPRKCEYWCNEGEYVYYVGSEYVGNIHPTCTEEDMNNPKPIYKRDDPQNSTCIVGYSLYNSCDIIFPAKDGALRVVYPSMNCCTQEGFNPTSTSCYCSEIPFCTRLRKLPTDESEGECVLLGGVCDLNSDCCSNNCQGGFCGSEIIPSYNCIGSIDSNALIVEGDDLDLIENVNKVLIESVSSNTPGKCEYYCRPGFEKGSGVDENKCLLIYGYYSGCDESNLAEGWLIYPGDYNDLTILDNITPILSESDTSKKCEYYCDSSLGLVMRNGSCVPQFATEGICGDANRIYYLNEEFPGWGELCKAGSALPNSGFNLGGVEGDFVEWLCTARDVNANCRATRSEANIFDVNAILSFSINNVNSEIIGNISCSNNTSADLILFDNKGINININPIKVNCGYYSNSFKISPSIDLNEGVFYSIRASIKETSPDCSICSKTVLFTPKKVRDEKIPDNSIITITLVLITILSLIVIKKDE